MFLIHLHATVSRRKNLRSGTLSIEARNSFKTRNTTVSFVTLIIFVLSNHTPKGSNNILVAVI